jgi:hypothetical protein
MISKTKTISPEVKALAYRLISERARKEKRTFHPISWVSWSIAEAEKRLGVNK